MNIPLLAGSAGFGFILALLSALIGGVWFGEAVLRALLGALIFSAFIQGLWFLLGKFLPELNQVSSSSSQQVSNEDSEPESRVNIVLPGEAPDFSDLHSSSERESDQGDSDEEGVLESVDADDRRIIQEDEGEVDDIEGGLPELSAFEKAFSSGQGVSNMGVEGSPMAGSSSVMIDGEEKDPAILARAVSTVLKRNKEG